METIGQISSPSADQLTIFHKRNHTHCVVHDTWIKWRRCYFRRQSFHLLCHLTLLTPSSFLRFIFSPFILSRPVSYVSAPFGAWSFRLLSFIASRPTSWCAIVHALSLRLPISVSPPNVILSCSSPYPRFSGVDTLLLVKGGRVATLLLFLSKFVSPTWICCGTW